MNNEATKIFKWYKIAMRTVVGRDVSLPNAKDATKTYMWRQFESYLKKINELEIDDDFAADLIITIVKYAKNIGLINRGASLLAKNDLFDICYRKLKNELTVERKTIEEVGKSVLFLGKQSSKGNGNGFLLDRKRPDAYANITCWFQTGKISKAHIALSRKCCSALTKLDDDERACFPSDRDLIKIRNRCLKHMSNHEGLRGVLKKDLATGGVV